MLAQVQADGQPAILVVAAERLIPEQPALIQYLTGLQVTARRPWMGCRAASLADSC